MVFISEYTIMSNESGMANGSNENVNSTVASWMRGVGAFDFLKGWRGAFQGRAVVLATAGLLVTALWTWILDRLWKESDAVGMPSLLLDRVDASWDSFFLLSAVVREQWFYGLCLLIPLAFLWALLGGAIWRMLACKQTETSHPSISRALEYAIGHYWKGFLLAWALPVGFGLLIGAMVVLYGMFMAIPWLGDLVGGVFFFIPLALGCLLAFGLLVVLIGGHLFAPGVAVSGSHGTDAVTSAVSYVLSRPIRAIAYFLTTCLMVWVTSFLLIWLVSLAESVTMTLASFGEGLLSTRGEAGSDKTSDFLIGFWLGGLHYLAQGVVTCVFFAGSVVSFLLLRESVDGTDRCELGTVGVGVATTSLVEPVDTP
ncbi:MAG: hypothetical protein DHS20C16_06210 [Phycisphaerae bacterium]|nr:MAG: hypothetical protein DHS20C16_06210 [Phycisphaerae bacterium]